MKTRIVLCALAVIMPHLCEPQRGIASTNLGMATQALIDAWNEELYSYRVDSGRFPSTKEGLKALRQKSSGMVAVDAPSDTWHNEIVYIYPPKYGTREFDLYSVGKNGVNEYGQGDDITNWTPLSAKSYFFFKWIMQRVLIALIVLSFLILLRKNPKRFKTKGEESG